MRQEEAIEYIVDFLKSWNPNLKKCLVVFGDLGVGKTYVVREACKRAGYVLEEPDIVMEDIESLERLVTTKSFWGRKKAVLLDRPHEEISLRMVKHIVNISRVPIIIEIDTESKKYYDFLMCATIYIYPPPKTQIVKMVKARAIPGIKPNYKAISNDVRQSLLTVYGSEGYTSESWSDKVEYFFKTGRATSLEDTHLPVILDTGIRVYQGLELVDFFKLLIPADMHRDPTILDGLKPSKPTINISYYFYERVKALKESSQSK